MFLSVLLPGCSLFGISFDGEDEPDTGAVATVDTGTAPQCSITTPEVRIGTGEFALVPLVDGDEVTMVHGPAGGWYLWAGAAVTGVSRIVGVATALTALDGEVIGDFEHRLDLTQLEGYGWYDRWTCAGTFWHVNAYLAVDNFFPPIDEICALEGRLVEVRVTVTAYEATDPSAPRDTGYPGSLPGFTAIAAASDSATIVLHIDPADEAYCRSL